jgi:hypothetical protein
VPKKVDANQPEIVAALRQVGASVAHTHMIGHGFPDILVLYRGTLSLIEIKAKGAKLTPDEQAWHERWPGVVHICHDSRETLRAVGADWSE